MREPPSPDLAELLQSLRLVGAEDWRRLGGEVRCLAGDLPRFESIWLDALVRNSRLTRWQAQEIAAGRGTALAVGPYVLEEPVAGCLFAPAFRAVHREQRQPARLIVLRSPAGGAAEEIAERLDRLVEQSRGLVAAGAGPDVVAPVVEHGRDGERLWITGPWFDGRTAAEWMVRTGRLPPDVVLHVAQAMSAVLAELESHDVVHGDLTLSSLLVGPDAELILPHPGLRGILRPAEGYAHAELPPEAYDSLSPQRVADGTPPDGSSDRYACGLLWQHMLGGRGPLVGGNSLAKLRAAHEARIPPLAELAIDVPDPLAEVIHQCTRPEPADRPDSFAAMAARLGPPTNEGRERFLAVLAAAGRIPTRRIARRGMAKGCVASGAAGVKAPANKRRWALAASAALVLLAVGVSAMGVFPHGGLREFIQLVNDDREPTQAGNVAAATTDGATSGLSDVRGSRPVVTDAAGKEVASDVVAMDPRDGARGLRFSDDGTASRLERITLPSGSPVELATVTLGAGQRLSPAGDARATVHVPQTGLRLRVRRGDGAVAPPARIERVDFVWPHRPRADAAMLIVEGESLVLDGCTFHVEDIEPGMMSSSALPVAVRWIDQPVAGDTDRLALPSGWLRMSRCRLTGVAAAVDCRVRGAVRLECDNLLHLGPGPLLVTPDAPAADEPMVIDLRRVTLRAAQALWLCRQADAHPQPGSVWIRAEQSIFVPTDADGGLLVFESVAPPKPLTHALRWTGEGSLIAHNVPIAAWLRPGGTIESLDDSRVPIAGLVRSRVEFAAAVAADPAANRPIEYQAPIRSDEPPGAVLGELP